MPSLGTRWLSSLRKYWWANERGGVSCPSQRATQMNLIRINPLHKKALSRFFYWFTKLLRNSNFHRSWLARFNLHIFFNEVQMETCAPLRNSPHYFLWKRSKVVIFFGISAHRARTSWLHYGRGAGDKGRVARVSTCAPRWRGIAAALQLALITLHHQKQSGYNEEHISGVDTVVMSLPCHSHSPGW